MNSIRKLVRICAGGSALCVMALVVASASVTAHIRPVGARGSFDRRAAEPTPSAACVAARQTIVKAHADDRGEDMSERLEAAQSGADQTSDVSEDKNERAARAALWDAARTACAETKATETTEPPATPPSSGCVAAKQALKNALVAEKAHERSEKGTTTEHSSADWQEDQAELAAIKSVWQQAATACGYSRDGFEHHSR